MVDAGTSVSLALETLKQELENTVWETEKKEKRMPRRKTIDMIGAPVIQKKTPTMVYTKAIS